MYEDLIAKRVSQLRMQKGVSARDMSLSLGQSESYINKIENKYGMNIWLKEDEKLSYEKYKIIFIS